MPHDLIDRTRIELLKEKTARLIEATRLTVQQCEETIERYRTRRQAEAQAAASQNDPVHEDRSRRVEQQQPQRHRAD